MIQSMTGFGSAEKDGFRVEIRSVNHRFMEISIRISPLLTQHEIPLRNILKERFSRGRFDVFVSTIGEGNVKLRLNRGLAREIYNALNSLKSELSIPGTIGIETIANYRELLITEEPEYTTDSLYDAFRDAAVHLEDMRVKEGEAIAKDLLDRAGRLESMNNQIIAICPDVLASCKERFSEKIKSLLSGVEYDEARVLQEIALMAEKIDITEEVTRIESHITQFAGAIRRIAPAGGDTIGRKLDFLLQELNREANTIASKADDYRVSNIVIEMKTEIEKMREQVQNIQ